MTNFSKILLLSFITFGINYSVLCQNITVKSSDSDFYLRNSKKVYAQGMSQDDFLKTCFIQWDTIKCDSSKWEPFCVDLSRQLRYSDFDEIIHKLIKSPIVKAYTASIKSEDGRSLYCLEIGNGSKIVTFTAGVHAREVANPQFLIKFASQLVSEYEKGDSGIIEILSKSKVVILPCINPDGFDATTQGNIAIKNNTLFFAKCNKNDLYQAKSNANGVDLNRNFPTYAAGLLWSNEQENTPFISRKNAIQFFCGDTLGCENETKIAMNFLMKYIPLSSKYVDFHSAGRIIYGGKPHLSDEFNVISHVTGELIKTNTHYQLLGLNEEETGKGTDGSTTDFAAEIAAGFIYNPNFGRLAPPDSVKLVTKTKMFKYPCSVNTVETLGSLFKEKKNVYLKPSTPQMHIDEWEKYHLYQLFLSLIDD